MYKKINNIFRIIVIEFLLVTFTIMGLHTFDALSSSRIFSIFTYVILLINLILCALFIAFYLIVGLILLFKVMTREKMPFIKKKLLELAVTWIIVGIISCIFKFEPRTYLGMTIVTIFITFSDVVKDEMSRLDKIRSNKYIE